MKLKAAFYEKFYLKFYDVLHLFEKGKISTGEPGSDLWIKRVPKEGIVVHLAPYYFQVSIKQYYQLYLDAVEGKDVWIDNIPYFKALLFVDSNAEKKLYPELDFFDLFEKNKKRKKNEEDGFKTKYNQKKLKEFHHLFAKTYIPDYFDETLTDVQNQKELLERSDIVSIALDKRNDRYGFDSWNYNPQRGIDKIDRDAIFNFTLRLDIPIYDKLTVLTFGTQFQIEFTDRQIYALLDHPQIEIVEFVIIYLEYLIDVNNEKYPQIKFFQIYKVAKKRNISSCIIHICEGLFSDGHKSKALNYLIDFFQSNERNPLAQTNIIKASAYIFHHFSNVVKPYNNKHARDDAEQLKKLVVIWSRIDIEETEAFIGIFRQIIQINCIALFSRMEEFFMSILPVQGQNEIGLHILHYAYCIGFSEKCQNEQIQFNYNNFKEYLVGNGMKCLTNDHGLNFLFYTWQNDVNRSHVPNIEKNIPIQIQRPPNTKGSSLKELVASCDQGGEKYFSVSNSFNDL